MIICNFFSIFAPTINQIRIMKYFLKLMAISTVALCSTSCSSKEETKPTADNKNVLVCYFSATGNTKADAERVARITSADLFEIQPETPYTDADLDWENPQSRSSLEMHDPDSRPAIKGVPDNIDSYDVIFIGFPNWWNLPPTLINNFIEKANLKGKTVVPFMTSGSSSIDNSEKTLKSLYPDINWQKGLRTTGASEKQLSEWARGIVYK